MEKRSAVKNRLQKRDATVRTLICVAAVVLLLIAVVSCAFLFIGERNKPEASDPIYNDSAAGTDELGETENAEDATGEELFEAFETVVVRNNASNENSEGETTLISGITVEQLLSVDGDFPEHGTSSYCEDTAAVRIKNNTGRTLEAITFKLLADGEEYSFSVSVLPPQKSVVAFELEKNSFPKELNKVEYKVDYFLFFEEEPELLNDKYTVEVLDGAVRVTNISGEDENGKISICYKNITNDCYYGGITYRLTLQDGLDADESVIATASHAAKNKTEIIFIKEYDE